MPISKENWKRYPREWKEISIRIRFIRAANHCEKCSAENYKPHPITGSLVVLSVAHLNHMPEDNREENLMALCQRCHLNHDRWYHRACKKTGDLFHEIRHTTKV